MYILNLEIVSFFQKVFSMDMDKGFLVGGAVRDILLCKRVNDYDIVLPSGKIEKTIEKLKADGVTVFCLDRKRDYYRVILNISDKKKVQMDISPIYQNSIYKDLSKRDFTINSMALPINFFLSGKFTLEDLIDPYGGREDIYQSRLRPIHREVFKDDPVRIIRGFRFIGRGYRPVKELFQLMDPYKEKLKNISSERIYWELFPLLEHKDYFFDFILLKRMQKLKLWDYILPDEFILASKINNFDAMFERLEELYLVEMEAWFFKLERAVLRGKYQKEDITYFKWLLWWSILAKSQELSGLKELIKGFNEHFPVRKRYKSFGEFFLEGVVLEFNSTYVDEVEKELEKILLKKLPQKEKTKEAFALGQLVGMKVKSSDKEGEGELEKIFYKKVEILESKIYLLKSIKKTVDGNFVLSYFDALPGPWVKEVLEEVYLELMKNFRGYNSRMISNCELLEESRAIIKDLKEREGFGGDYHS